VIVQFVFLVCYQLGRGTAQDYDKAWEYYWDLATNKKHPSSMTALGHMCQVCLEAFTITDVLIFITLSIGWLGYRYRFR
jgi:hypothetical protein